MSATPGPAIFPKAPKAVLSVAPAGLTAAAKRLWVDTLTDWALERHHLPVLRAAVFAYDTMLRCRADIVRRGLTLRSGKAVKQNPACRLLSESTLRFLQSWKQLGLDQDPPKDVGRPAGGG